MGRCLACLFALCWTLSVEATFGDSPKSKSAAPQTALNEALGRRLLDAEIPLREVQAYIAARIPPMPVCRTAADWDRYATRARQRALDAAVFRGAAADWRRLPTRVERQGSIDGGLGYKIIKLRYEAVPGLWIPALLYEPTNLKDKKVPVSLAVNGHDKEGKAAAYKQLRCINQAKRGMIVLNTEFLGMGQLYGDRYNHYRMNQLDLCGTSGVAPFYLAMSRGLDLLLDHPNADPNRVAVQGLSGGGWQTITISALDPRVTLSNPVAGYSSLVTRVQNVSDLGDSEQNPTDLETVVDYAQMTALLAPRPALLTFNFADTCCFKADHALPPLFGAAQPIYRLYGKPQNLRSHVNHVPGDHNFGLDNRQQFYRMLKDFFFANDPMITANEIPSEKEIKTAQQLNVDLPPQNADFNSLARSLMADLPRNAAIPSEPAARARWRNERRGELKKIVRGHGWDADAMRVGHHASGEWTETDWWFRIGQAWTVPAVEVSRDKPSADAIVLADGGRTAAAGTIEKLLKSGHRVLGVDLFYFGESKISQRDVLFAIALSSVGERALGVQASQLAAIARWRQKTSARPCTVVAVGPRSSLIAAVAAALEPTAIGGLKQHDALPSLKDVILKDKTMENAPELFCYGLLERFDVPQILALGPPVSPATRP